MSAPGPVTIAPMRRRLFVRLALVLGSLTVVLVTGEILARVLVPERAPIRFEQNVKMLEHQDRAGASKVLEHDPELFWRLIPDTVLAETDWPLRGRIANAQGFRETLPIARAKPAGEVRIFFLGDSCTFGTGLLPEQGFVQRTEEFLRERHPGARIECVNAGVPGYTSFQGWRLLETKVLGFDPDLVVITFGWNEISLWDGKGDVEHHEAWVAERPPSLFAWSRLAQLAVRRTSGDGEVPGSSEEDRRLRLTPDEFRATLERFRGTSREREVALLVVVWPIPQNFAADPRGSPENRFEVQRIAREFGESLELVPGGPRAEVDLIGVARGLLAEHGLAGLFLDHVHGTALANEAFARAIAEKLDPWLAERLRRGGL